ncbi:MAG: hypothetical protein RL722_2834, partial [Pseudomonadota bacterium]
MNSTSASPARDALELATLAAIWGASFLFMRMGAVEFGAQALAFLRVAGASLLLLPLLLWRGEARALLQYRWRIGLVGLTNSALPFICFAFAAQSLGAGLSAIFNATTPLWGAVIGVLWLGDRLERSRWLGLAVGFAGVLWLAWDHAHLGSRLGHLFGPADVVAGVHPEPAWAMLAPILACLAAAVMYGFSGNFTKRHLQGIPPMALACGSQLGSALVLAIPAGLAWPAQSPGPVPWWAAGALA